MQPKAAVEVRRPLSHDPTANRLLLDISFELCRIECSFGASERQVQRRSRPARHLREPIVGNLRERTGLPQRVAKNPVDEGVSRELRVLFPAKLESAEGLIEARGTLPGRVRVELGAQLPEVGPFGRPLLRPDLHGDVTDGAGRLDQGRRPAVKLVMKLGTRGMHVEGDRRGHRGHLWGDGRLGSTGSVARSALEPR